MASPTLTFEHAHAVDAPHADYGTWLDSLAFGMCTACGQDAWRGLTSWWHSSGARLCPNRGELQPTFAPDADD